MIAYLAGTLGEIWGRSCLVLTQAGIGYQVALPDHTLAGLPSPGSPVAFYTYLAVREDAMELFGFATFEERQAFGILTGISRVGARTALAILSVFRPDSLRAAVMEDNLGALLKVPGIGQKTAQHILLELKYKLAAVATGQSGAQQPANIYGDTLAALLNLGYSESECAMPVREILKREPDLDVGSAIRLALKALAKGKA